MSGRGQSLLVLSWCILVSVIGCLGIPKTSFGEAVRSEGQTVYLSVIPQIQSGPRRNVSYLGLLLVVRNTSLKNPATIRSITYHNASGEIEKEILEQPLTLAPLASSSFGFQKKDLGLEEGMSGCMIVRWEAQEMISPMLVEGILLGAGTGWSSGVVFKGVVIDEK